MSGGDWLRVDRDSPCPVCGKSDWCLRSRDGSAAICPRTESPKRCGDAGWLHRLDTDTPSTHRPRTRTIRLASPARDFGGLAEQYRQAVDPDRLQRLADHLGLTVASLRGLGIGWSEGYRAWSFPMADAGGRVVGIRLRRSNGSKFAVRGGREGLHLPTDLGSTDTPPASSDTPLLICEGPTDTAALLDMGFPRVVGRPSCSGCITLMVELVRRWAPPEVVVVADGDAPGQQGAGQLASALVCYAPAVRVVVPPAGVKDARQWLQREGTRQEVEQAIAAAAVRRLKVGTGKGGQK